MVWLYVRENFPYPKILTPRRMFSSDCMLFSPPHPVKKFYYKCDRKFHLDDLISLYEEHDNNAIVLVSGKRTDFYLHNPIETKFLKSISVTLPNQFKAGGYSAPRFERIRNEKIGVYVKKICELMVSYYVTEGVFNCKKLVIAGPAELKDLVCKEEIFIKYFSTKLAGIFTIGEISDTSIYQVINLTSASMNSESDEHEYISNIESMILDPSKIDFIVFGEEEVLALFHANQLKEIYISNASQYYNDIASSNNKTKIIPVKNITFAKKYGQIVGIRYYSNLGADCDKYIEV